MRSTLLVLGGLWLAGCGDKDGDSSADTGAEAATDDQKTAPLAELSSGACPDMSVSGATTSFVSSDEDRTVTILYPSAREADMPVVFFFHGLMDPGSTPEPTTYMAQALGLQDMADELGAIIVLPQSPIWNYAGIEFFLWKVEDGTYDSDIALFDDLRTCVAQEFSPDLDRVFAVGFSGGSLFTTIVASQRGDTLAGIVEMSGGADLEVALAADIVAPYETPAYAMPALLATGGDNDVWPSASFPIVDFVAGTDTLQANLAADGHFAVRCRHERGHTITSQEVAAAKDWILAHRFGEPSPFEADGLGDSMSDWCEVAEAAR